MTRDHELTDWAQVRRIADAVAVLLLAREPGDVPATGSVEAGGDAGARISRNALRTTT